MRKSESHPFLAPPDEDFAGTGTDGLGATAWPGQVSSLSSAVVPEDQRSLPLPTRAGQGAQIEGLTELPEGGEGEAVEGAESGNSTEGELSIPDNIFDPSFDLDSLDPAIRTQVEQARQQFDEARGSLPSNDVLQQTALEAAGFRRITQSEQFKRFLQEYPNELGDGTAQGVSATPSVKSSNDPAMQKLLEQFDEGQINALQSFIDNAVAEKVDPVSDSYFRDKAEQTLTNLVTKYGADTWKKHEPAILQTMKDHNVSTEFAARAVIGEAALNQMNTQEAITTKRKIRNSAMGGGSAPAVSEPPKAKKAPRTMREAVLQAEEMYEQKQAWGQ